jgi:hypothetical protein
MISNGKNMHQAGGMKVALNLLSFILSPGSCPYKHNLGL